MTGSNPATGTVIAILQARMSSSRLPGKVMAPILGRPMLQRQIERVRRARRFDRLVVATSERADDDAIDALCREIDTACFRGALVDVLDRFCGAARHHAADHVVRLTGDCPLADPELIDAVIALHISGEYDYTTNTMPPTWPDGLDVEVIRAASLADAGREARLPSEREHVTPFIRNRPERFRHGNLKGTVDRSGIRWVVDDPEDFELVRAIYERLYPANPAFTTADVLSLLDAEPALAGLNAGIARNAGLEKSLAADREMLKRQAVPGD